MPPPPSGGRVLLIGASRGLGLALAREWVRGGWHVVATVRRSGRTRPHDLPAACAGQIEIETLQDRVEPAGTIGVMSSGQGSVANNEHGGHEVYRGSKAALNTFMRSYAARHSGSRRTLVLMAPGWVRTELGGPDARLSIDDSIPNVVRTLDALQGRSGLHYVDYLGRTVAW